MSKTVKMAEWPKVLPNDDGIRPAGPQDECLYCGSKVGELHSGECVCVSSLIELSVHANGKRVGTWRRYVPYWWTFENIEFHLNESSWCADNALGEIVWTDEEAKTEAEAMSTEDSCCCPLLSFEFESTVDAGPFVEIRE